MQNDHDRKVIELGSVSNDTLGTNVPATPEDHGFYPLGLTDE